MTSSVNPPAFVNVIENKIMDEKPKSNSVSAWCSAQWRAILAEFVSTCILIIFGCMTCIPVPGIVEHSPLSAPLGFGLAVMFNIQIFGHISGAHMNPAVTLVAIIWGNITIVLGICYIFVQALGATIGYGILMAVTSMDIAASGVCVSIPHSDLNVFQALVIEIIMTGALSFLCCALWDPVNHHTQDSIPIKFGLTITGLSLATGPLTGAGMNPARSLGPAIWTGIWNDHWAYWVGPFVGAAFAATFYKLIFLRKY